MVASLLLLTATLGSAPSAADRQHVRLLAQAESPSKVRLLAQADATREAELEGKLTELNGRIRNMSTDVPVASLILGYAGYVLAPFILIGLPVMAIGLIGSAAGGAALAPVFLVGVALTAVGAIGVGLLIYGIVTGVNRQAALKEERQKLINERDGYQRELDALKRQRGAQVRAQPVLPPSQPALVTIARF